MPKSKIGCELQKHDNLKVLSMINDHLEVSLPKKCRFGRGRYNFLLFFLFFFFFPFALNYDHIGASY
jgi:hypothetical protein